MSEKKEQFTVICPKCKGEEVHWCDTCDKEIGFDRNTDFIERRESFSLKGETVTVDAKIPICPVCKDEITDDVMDSAIMKSGIRMYEIQTGKSFK